MSEVNKAFNSTISHTPKTNRHEKTNQLSEQHLRTKKLYDFKNELRDLGLSESEIQTALKFQSY
ncbi:hypothetical protein [Shewanella baltica]|uniref:hypothetical protein n=1 Tax=Shewanella baltica TaxID=62322 RepID=UPI00216A790B|nr:hypothetical protein [Shewanella baltica]MCS6116866.1 hypothetical protein [Shewanella baltica]UVW66480.1 hypothetical protein HHE93_23385 [Shewanella baltica]